MSARPPLFERLLLHVVGHDVRGRSIAGDLREEYAQRPIGAVTQMRYAIACLRLALRYAPARVLSVTGRSVAAFRLDLRQSARGLGHAPMYWLGCMATLALGIGAATTIGTVVYGALLQPLPFPHPERLVRFGDASLKNPVGLSSASIPNFVDLQRRARTLEVMAAYRSERSIVSGSELSERLQGAFVTPNFFQVFELPPLAGRWFEAADQSTRRVVVISERAWRRLLGGRRDAVGQTIQIDLVDHVVIGIAGPDQVALGAVDFWKPIRWDAEALDARRRRSIEPIGRLQAGVTVEQARDELRALFAELGREHPGRVAGHAVCEKQLPGRADRPEEPARALFW